MKKIYYLLSISLLPLFSSCGDDIDPIEREYFNVEWDTSIPIKDVSEPMRHPGLFMEADYQRGRENIASGQAPFITMWDNLNSQCDLNIKPNPTVKIIRDGNKPEEPEPTNFQNANYQVTAAYNMALRWRLTSEDKKEEAKPYADKAVEILNAWARVCERVSGDPNYALAAGLTGAQFSMAGEVLRGYEGWAEADFKKFQEWVVKVFADANSNYLKVHMGSEPLHYWANWDLCNLCSMMAAGILADRRDIYNEAIRYLLNGIGNGRLTRAVNHVFTGEYANFAQLQESGRDQGHATLVIGLLGQISQLAWTQGDDIYGYNDNQFLKACEYTSCYNVARLDVPFERYYYKQNWTDGYWLEEVGSDARGNNRHMWDMPYYHYTKIKHATEAQTKYTYMGYKSKAAEKDNDNDLIGYSALMFGVPF